MSDPKSISSRSSPSVVASVLQFFGVIALRIVPSLDGDSDDLLDASLHHATGFHVGTGSTEAEAIEAAFAKLRRTLLVAGRHP